MITPELSFSVKVTIFLAVVEAILVTEIIILCIGKYLYGRIDIFISKVRWNIKYKKIQEKEAKRHAEQWQKFYKRIAKNNEEK